jgi:hypothetical protein
MGGGDIVVVKDCALRRGFGDVCTLAKPDVAIRAECELGDVLRQGEAGLSDLAGRRDPAKSAALAWGILIEPEVAIRTRLDLVGTIVGIGDREFVNADGRQPAVLQGFEPRPGRAGPVPPTARRIRGPGQQQR